MPSPEAKKAYRRRNRERGLCRTCGSASEAGKSRCRRCLDNNNRWTKLRHARNKDQGLCVRCSKPRGEGGDSNRCRPCADKIIAQKLQIKLACFSAYGGPVCACCGEKGAEFLTLDHIGGGGTQHRKRIKNQSLYQVLRREGYPPGYQVLCFNCNCAKGLYGTCPHQRPSAL